MYEFSWSSGTLLTLNPFVFQQTQFASEDVGPHLLGVEELLQAHALQELQLNSLGETQRRFVRQGQAIKHNNQKDMKLLEKNLAEMEKAYLE